MEGSGGEASRHSRLVQGAHNTYYFSFKISHFSAFQTTACLGPYCVNAYLIAVLFLLFLTQVYKLNSGIFSAPEKVQQLTPIIKE